MTSRRTTTTEALVVRSVDFGESDRILTLVTRELGKVAVLARGVRKGSKRFGGALEPFAVVRAEIGSGRGEVQPLAGASIARAFPRVLSDLARMELAGKALELVRDVVQPAEPDERVFETAVEMLALLDAEEPRDTMLVAFTLRLCAVLGLAPRLDRCARCGAVAPEGKAALFDPRMSSVICTADGGGPLRLSGETRALASRCLRGDWSVVAAETWSAKAAREMERLADAMVRTHLARG